jgi:hypothetical protein
MNLENLTGSTECGYSVSRADSDSCRASPIFPYPPDKVLTVVSNAHRHVLLSSSFTTFSMSFLAASFWNHAPNPGAGLSLGSVTTQKMTGSYTNRSNWRTTGSSFAAWRATKAGMVVVVVFVVVVLSH